LVEQVWRASFDAGYTVTTYALPQKPDGSGEMFSASELDDMKNKKLIYGDRIWSKPKRSIAQRAFNFLSDNPAR
jgi:hypothetical protein